MDLSAYLRTHARTIPGKIQLILTAFARALEIIPRQICDNAGLDSTDVLNMLRQRHASGDVWAGVDVEGEGVRDNMEAFVWEPSLVKVNAIGSAAEAACLILSVDETVRNPQSEVVSLVLRKILIRRIKSCSSSHDFALFYAAEIWSPGITGTGTESIAWTRSRYSSSLGFQN
jgi:TCP-1/cpn60 chaperonin family